MISIGRLSCILLNGVCWSSVRNTWNSAQQSACWPKIDAVLSPQPAWRHHGQTLWKSWLLLLKQNNLHSQKTSKCLGSMVLISVFTNDDKYEGSWKIYPCGFGVFPVPLDMSNSTLLSFLLVDFCKPSRDTNWQWPQSPTKAAWAPQARQA